MGCCTGRKSMQSQYVTGDRVRNTSTGIDGVVVGIKRPFAPYSYDCATLGGNAVWSENEMESIK